MSGEFEPADDVFEKRKPDKRGIGYGEKNKRHPLRRAHYLAIFLLSSGLFCGIFALVWLVLSPMVTNAGDSANAFMVALRDKDYEAAYELGTADFQNQVQHPENLIVLLQHPRDWQFNSFSIKNAAGRVSGSVQLDDGSSRAISIFLQQERDGWKISGINF